MTRFSTLIREKHHESGLTEKEIAKIFWLQPAGLPDMEKGGRATALHVRAHSAVSGNCGEPVGSFRGWRTPSDQIPGNL